VKTVKRHWREYFIEAGLLAVFMLSACFFTALLEHPASPLASAQLSGSLRRACIGIAMGVTAILLIYSPAGRRSGAHMNPSVTFTFYRLGKIAWQDAVLYGLAQFTGAAAAVWIAAMLFPGFVGHPSVDYVVTEPGPLGVAAAFAAEAAISFVLMFVVLKTSSSPRFGRYTGFCAGLMVATFISIEAPLSGMSMNPARSFGSALVAGHWQAIWLYFLAPTCGMLLAAELYVRQKGREAFLCAKMHHDHRYPCLFCDHHKGRP